MTKKQTVLEIKRIFDELYGDAICSLEYKTPFQLLIATQLAAQCTDARVNMVTGELFKKYPTPHEMAQCTEGELISIIHSTGFFRNKAKNIISCSRRLISEFGGEVPDTMEQLLTLAGVGRKTANLILGDVFGKPAIVVDTHAGRISRRIGLTANTDPTRVEADLKRILPPEYGSKFCHQLVFHGRAVCTARSPKCARCQIFHLCMKKI